MKRCFAFLLAGCLSVAVPAPANAAGTFASGLPRAAVANSASIPTPSQGGHPHRPAIGSSRTQAPKVPVPQGTWSWQNPKPNGDPLFSISCPTTSVCFAAGYGWPIMATIDGGTTWVEKTGPQFLNAISCADASNCVAVGDFGLVMYTHGGGAVWNSAQLNGGNFLSGVSCNSQTCFAVGSSAGAILRSDNGGNSWIGLSPHTTQNLFAISCVGTSFCVAVGDNGAIVKATDGSTFSVSSSGTAGALWGVSCPTTTDCAAVGENGYAPVTSNAGATWPKTITGPVLLFTAVSCAGGTTHCFAAGVDGSVYVESACSTTINQVGCWEKTSTGETGVLYGISCPSVSVCFAGGDFGIVVGTSNGGTGWLSQSPYTSIPQLAGVSCPSTSICTAVGASGSILATSDGGATWPAQASGITNDLRAVACPSTTVCFAAGTAGTILNTTNSGGAWNGQTSGTSNHLNAISCASTSVCIAVGDGGTIVGTTNGGTNWNPQTSSTADPIFGVSCPSASVCFAVASGAILGGFGGTIEATTDGGAIWATQTTVNGRFFSAITCTSTSACYADGLSALYATTNGGTNWNDQTPGGNPVSLTSVSCASASVCIAVGSASGTGTTILGTTDSGAHWDPQLAPKAMNLTGVSCPSTTACVAVSNGDTNAFFPTGSIAATNDGGATRWHLLAPSGTTADLSSISCASASTCFAVAGPAVLATKNSGTGWFPLVTFNYTQFKDISCPSTTVCYAVGSTQYNFGESTIYGTTDGGNTWNALVPASAGPPTVDPGYSNVSCPTTTTCYAVAGNGNFVKTVNGTSWSAPVSVGAGNLSAISCPSTTVCFVSDASTPGHVWVTSNGGGNWTLSWNIATDPNAGNNGPFLAIDCPGLLQCFVTGTNGLIATTSDGGGNWRTDGVDSTASVIGIDCPSTCFATTGDGSILRTADNGGIWSAQFPNRHSAYAAVSCVDAETCVAVGNAGAIQGTTTHGDAWTTSRPAESTAPIHGMSCYGSSNCYAAASNTLFATHDGANWTSEAFASGDQYRAISCPGVNTCFAVGWPGAIIATTNGGVDWLPQPNSLYGADQTLLAVSCASPTHCVAVGTRGIVLSTVDGTTWNPETSGTTASLVGLSCPTASSCVAVGSGGLTLTRTSGTWQSHPSGTLNTLIAVTCITTNTCYAVGAGGVLRVTTNRGATWAARTSGTTEVLRAIACTKPTFCVAVGNFGTAIVTVDGGSWKPMAVPTFNDLAAAAYPDLDHAWLAGLGGTIIANSALIPSCTSVSITPDVSSPGAVGAIVTLTGAASGCPDPNPQYRFYLRNPAGVWSIVRNFSTNPSFAWNTASYAAGTYLIGVWAKDSKSGFTYDAYAFGTFTLQRMPCAGVNVQSDIPSPEPSGMLVNFSITTPVACPQPLEQWWVRNPAGVWSIVSPYASGNDVYAWHTDGLADGTYQVGVWARQKGSTKSYEAYSFVTYTLYSGAIDAVCHSVGVSADQSSPMAIGPTVNLTALANCDTPQYKWWVRDPAGNWTVVRNYSGTATYAWATSGRAAGTYQLGVWARQGGSTVSYQAYSFITFTLINPMNSNVCNFVNVLPGMASPEPPGQLIYFTAVYGGCLTPNFQFWVLPPGGTWTIVQPYGLSNQYVWDTTGLSPGPWQIGVWVRQSSSTSKYQAFAFITFQLTFG